MIVKIIYPFLLLYLFFVPTGPLVIEILEGLKLDVLIGIILLFLTLPYISNINLYKNNFILITACFVVATFISVLLSDDILHSLKSWLIFFGYLYVAIIVPTIYSMKVNHLRNFLILVSFLTSLFILFDYSNFDKVYRYSLPHIDPNTTAIGLMFAMLMFSSKENLYYKIPILIFIFLSAIILQSRTAVIAYISAITLTQLYFSLKYKKSSTIPLLGMFVIFFSIYFLFPDIVQNYLSRVYAGANNDHRFELLNNALTMFFVNYKSILFGTGYMINNPHNEIMRALSNSGLFGLLSYTFFMLYLLFLTLKIQNKDIKFTALSIFVYLAVVIQTYGHTKFMYVSYMFILMLYLKDRNTRISAPV